MCKEKKEKKQKTTHESGWRRFLLPFSLRYKFDSTNAQKVAGKHSSNADDKDSQ